MKTIEEFADEIVAASQMKVPPEIFRAGVIVSLLAYGELCRSDGFRDGEAASSEMHDLMAN